MVKKRSANKKTAPLAQLQANPQSRLGFAIGVLVINVLIPGLGTLLAGKIRTGVWQLILLAVGAILSPFLIGIPLVIAAWIWALVTSAKMLNGLD